MPPFPETTTHPQPVNISSLARTLREPCANLARISDTPNESNMETCALQALPDMGSLFLLARVLAHSLRELARTRAESFRPTPLAKAMLYQKESVARGYFETIIYKYEYIFA
jgi:hypothetical protein